MGTTHFLEPNIIIPLVAIGGGLLVGAIVAVTALINSAKRVREKELSRREIAAYVAEGSMTAEDAERILKAGRESEGSCRG